MKAKITNNRKHIEVTFSTAPSDLVIGRLVDMGFRATDNKFNHFKIKQEKLAGSLAVYLQHLLRCDGCVVSNDIGLGMAYVPTSQQGDVLDVEVPDSMSDDIHIAARKIKLEIGMDFFDYVCEKIDYTPTQLIQALKAEQIDAVAMAIYNIEKGYGIIIGDQTGIGKGRVAAMLCVYAKKQGMKPIFITEKPSLFSDIYRDIVDVGGDDAIPLEIANKKPVEKKIRYKKWDSLSAEEKLENGSEDEYEEFINAPENQYELVYKRTKNPHYDLTIGHRMVPFIINGPGTKTQIIDKNGNVLYKALTDSEHKSALNTGVIPPTTDVILMTYSQVSSPKSAKKRALFSKLAQGTIIVMDESHNASGSSQTGEFLQSVIKTTKGVVFLSATFAKRPDNMPIYAMKTSMIEANMGKEQLVEAIANGGVALQEVLASQLASEGQLLRRQRSFDNIKVKYNTLDDLLPAHRAIADNFTAIIRSIIKFQSDYVEPMVELLDSIAAGDQGEAEVRKGTKGAGVDSSPYFSRVFNVINQFLFSLKSEAVADLAIQRLNEGMKPVIAFSNTMGSFLEDMGTVGTTINTDFSSVLMKALSTVMKYTKRDDKGKPEKDEFNVSELSPEGQEEYWKIVRAIDITSTGLNISPIDVIKAKIEKAGFTVAEVTGRKIQISFTNKNMSAGVITPRKRENTNEAFMRFNDNEADCLLINQSGSTGASAHAVPTPKVSRDDVRTRVMIILQAELNVNTEVQKRGRINRTGQILPPIYDYVFSAIPAEKRLMMMLRKKLKSLDANTSADQNSSKKQLNTDDFLNKIGDKIVRDYLLENKEKKGDMPSLNDLLGNPLKFEGKPSDAEPKEGDAHKTSGRVAILPVDMQENFYDEVLDRYARQVIYLDSIDEYDLEVQTLNLQAETMESIVGKSGKGGTSAFGEDANLETCECNVLRKPFKKVELENILDEYLDGRTTEDVRNELIEQMEQHEEARLASDLDALNHHYERSFKNIPNEPKYAKASDKNAYVKERTEKLEISKKLALLKAQTQSQSRSSYLRKYFKFFYPGRSLNYPALGIEEGHGQYTPAVFAGFLINEKARNPFAPSAIESAIAISDSRKFVKLSLSGEHGAILERIIGRSYELRGLDGVEVKDRDDRIYVYSEYNKDWVIAARKRGKFHKYEGKSWSFPKSEEAWVRQQLIDIYGTDGNQSVETVDICLFLDEEQQAQSLVKFGRQLLHTWGKGKSVKLGEGVSILEGDVVSSGSYRNPMLRWDEGTVLQIRDVPKNMLERSSGTFEIITGDTPPQTASNQMPIDTDLEVPVITSSPQTKTHQYLVDWDELTKNSMVNRKTRYIITGNLLMGAAEFDKGKLVDYTTMSGESKKGILMPDNWTPSESKAKTSLSVPVSKIKRYILGLSKDGSVTLDRSIGIFRLWSGDFRVLIPKGGKNKDLFTDMDLIALIENVRDGFIMQSGNMVANVDADKMERFLDVLGEKFSLSASVPRTIFEMYAEKTKPITNTSSTDRQAIEMYRRDKASFEDRKLGENSKVDRLRKMKMKAMALKLKMEMLTL